MKKLIIGLIIGVAIVMMSSGVSASTLLLNNYSENYTVKNISMLHMDKCISSECANVSQWNAPTSVWLCDASLCPHYRSETGYVDGQWVPSGWYLFSEDICMANKIKWKSFGWILSVNNTCTNFEAFNNCTTTSIEGNTIVACGDFNVW